MPPESAAQPANSTGVKIDQVIANALEPGEIPLASTRRHIIALIFLYLQTFLAVAAITLFVFFLAPEFLRDLTAQESLMLTIASVFFVTLIVFILILLTNVYLANMIVITNKAVLQELQRGPFHRKVSRLSMADVEDVTAKQNGLLPTLFNYGELRIETAGELRNFEFPYCPSPDRFAKITGEARQRYAETNPGG